ncbi:MAG: hypothetical protein DRN04_13375 [Thermoprotei archaeon]|nr:MAG: hypothetical protein DRN04_13375 [Thermoprotei archaeon]
MIGVIVWKELKETIRDKSILSSGFSVLSFLTLLNVTILKHNIVFNVESLVFYIAPCLGVLAGFGLSSRLVREKREGVVETLLCTPITLRELWLGKVIGLTLPSYLIALMSMMLFICLREYRLNEVMIAYLAIAIPVIIASAIGILGLLQYALGMRQIQILNYIVFFTLFTILYLVVRRLTVPGNSIMSWWSLGVVLTISLTILSVAFYLVAHLGRERIVTTII